MDRMAWWQTAVMYQVYPRSFQDGDGDGVGDLRGIRRRLPYLIELGVDAVWISPIFPSPMADFGYDVSDYIGVDPLFGSLAELDGLLEEAHAHGLKILLDLVPNHTSERHPWFQDSRSSRHSARRDWYIWRDAAPGGGPPNNWLSAFGGSAWEWDEGSGQYYYHAFLAAQPDLNWRTPAVRECDSRGHAVLAPSRGRRVPRGRDLASAEGRPVSRQPPEPGLSAGPAAVSCPHPGPHDGPARGTRSHRGAPASDRRVPGPGADRRDLSAVDRLVAYYGHDLEGAHLLFNFALLEARWHARDLAKLIDEYEAALPRGGWPNWVLGNHDQPRIAGRVGRDQASIAAVLLLTLRGTPTIYYGDEIGMPQEAIPPDRVCDPLERNVPGLGCGRDGARTPMQWDATPHAGFSPVEPWLPVAAGFATHNVESERRNPASIYHLHRRLIALRRRSPSLQGGRYRPIVASGDLLVFVREHENERSLIGLNLGGEAITMSFPDRQLRGEILVSSTGDRDGAVVAGTVTLRANEGVVMSLAPDVVVPPSIP